MKIRKLFLAGLSALLAPTVECVAQSNTFPATGDVGIGTTNPAFLLDIQSNADSTAMASVTNSNSGGNVTARFTVSNGAKTGFLGIYGTGAAGGVGELGGDVFVAAPGIGQSLFLEGVSGVKFATYNGSWGERMRVDSSGNVGIGTTNPQRNLSVVGMGSATLQIADQDQGSLASEGFQIQQIGLNSNIINEENGYLAIWSNATERMRIGSNGNVGIGTTLPAYPLSVNGTIEAKEVIVQSGWSDYVFGKNYKLAPLSKVERTIETEHHLPGMPSATEVAKNGVSLGNMQAKLLAQVEELTLRLIECDKRMAAQDAEIQALRAELARISSRKAQ